MLEALRIRFERIRARYGDPVPQELSGPLQAVTSAYHAASTLRSMVSRDSREGTIATQWVPPTPPPPHPTPIGPVPTRARCGVTSPTPPPLAAATAPVQPVQPVHLFPAPILARPRITPTAIQ